MRQSAPLPGVIGVTSCKYMPTVRAGVIELGILDERIDTVFAVTVDIFPSAGASVRYTRVEAKCAQHHHTGHAVPLAWHVFPLRMSTRCSIYSSMPRAWGQEISLAAVGR